MKTRLRFRRWDEYARSVDIEVSWDVEDGETDTRRLVSVSQGISLDDFSPEVPRVNWSSIGAVTPTVALAMAEALTTAVDVAVNMARLTTWERITPKDMLWRGEGVPEVFITESSAWVTKEGWVPRPEEG